MEKIALIVAGGTGKRMKSEVPKQFLLLRGIPVLMHTIAKFYQYDRGMRIILVLPGDQIPAWKELCEKDDFKILHEIVDRRRNAVSLHTKKHGPYSGTMPGCRT